MFTYCRYSDYDILLDLTGADDWSGNEKFIQKIVQLSHKKLLTLAGTPKFEDISPKTHFARSEFMSHLGGLIYDDLDTDETGILIISNSAEHVKSLVKQQFSVVFLTNNAGQIDFDSSLMPDEIWSFQDFYSYIENPEQRFIYASEGIGFPTAYELKPRLFKLKPLQIPERDKTADIVFTGRYFPLKDNRHYNSPLSRGIIGWKNNLFNSAEAAKERLGKVIGMYLRQDRTVSKIVFVPPRPGKQSRFIGVENYFKTNIGRDIDLLRVQEHYESPKELVTFDEKHELVKNKMECQQQVSGHILLVDDVFTSGATTLECARALYDQGADNVTVLPLAFTQEYDYYGQSVMPAIFNDDGDEYHIYFNGNGGFSAYWSSRGEQGKYVTKEFNEIDKEYISYHGVWSLKRPEAQEYRADKDIRAVIFDLDNTLLETDHLEKYRVKAVAVEDVDLPKAEHVIIKPEMLAALKQIGLKVGIVTRSPRKYAESVLKALHYPYDCLVAFRDTLLTKPFPDPLIKCTKILKVEAKYTVHIGDLKSDETAGERAGMMNVHVDTVIKHNEIKQIIDYNTDLKFSRGD